MAENKKEIEEPQIEGVTIEGIPIEKLNKKEIDLYFNNSKEVRTFIEQALSTQKQEFEKEKQIKISAMEDFCNKDELIFLQGLFGSKDLREEIENRIGKISSKVRLREELKQKLGEMK